MSEEEPERGAHMDDAWRPVAAVAAATGCTTARISQMALRGRITRRKDPKSGAWLYSQEEVMAFLNGEDVTTPESEAVKLLRQAHQHLENSFKMVHDPAQKVLDLLASTNGKLLERIGLLETAQVDLIKARESALNEAHIRDLHTALEVKKSERWDAAFETLKKNAPHIGMEVLATLQAWLLQKQGPGRSAIEILRELRAELEKLDLTPEQRARMKVIFEQDEASNPEANGAAT